MSLAARVMKLFKIEVPFCKANVANVLRQTVGEANFKKALRHLIRTEEKLVLEQYDKDELIEMMLEVNCPADYDATLDEYFESYVRNDVESIEDFVEYLDRTLPKNLLL